eukprot:TRINITY_DN1401_c0_g2_i1.p1 TRINITY_DN1401_c0_g2~~TRINITY_DN1401_c0_g2_i1.p1  ORF type:complete len:642 (-),score=90.05 TRINITY_DN1401_c0_g2_i1:128-1885(-)
MLVAGLQVLGFKGQLDEEPFERPNTLLLANVLLFLYQKYFGEDAANKTFAGIWPPKDIGRVPNMLPGNFQKIVVEWIHDMNKDGYIPNSLSLACKSLLLRAQGPRLIELLCAIIFKTLEVVNKGHFQDDTVTSRLSDFLQEEKNLPEDLQFVMLSLAKTQTKRNQEEALSLEQQLAEQWNVIQEATKQLYDLENKSVMELQEAKRKAQDLKLNIFQQISEQQWLANNVAEETRQRKLEKLNSLWRDLGEELSQQCKYSSLVKKCLSEDLYVNAIRGKQLQQEAGWEHITEELNLNQVVDDATRALSQFKQHIATLYSQGGAQQLQIMRSGSEGGSYEYLEHVLNKHRQQLESLKKLKSNLIGEIKELDESSPALLEAVESLLPCPQQNTRRLSMQSEDSSTPFSARQRSPSMTLMPPTPPIMRLANPFLAKTQNTNLHPQNFLKPVLQFDDKEKEKEKESSPTFEDQNDPNNVNSGVSDKIKNNNRRQSYQQPCDNSNQQGASYPQNSKNLIKGNSSHENETSVLSQQQNNEMDSQLGLGNVPTQQNVNRLGSNELQNKQGEAILMSPDEAMLKQIQGEMRCLSP